LRQVVGQSRRHRAAGDVASPEVADCLEAQRLVVAQQFEAERQTGSKRSVRQRTLAEAVNREHGGFVEGMQRRFEAQAHLRLVDAGVVLDGGDQTGDEGVGSARAALQIRKDIDQTATDALAQLGGRRVGEGDHQDLWRVEAPLEQQAQVESAEVPGLAGARRRLDQA
jgi:hypothetical protein